MNRPLFAVLGTAFFVAGWWIDALVAVGVEDAAMQKNEAAAAAVEKSRHATESGAVAPRAIPDAAVRKILLTPPPPPPEPKVPEASSEGDPFAVPPADPLAK